MADLSSFAVELGRHLAALTSDSGSTELPEEAIAAGNTPFHDALKKQAGAIAAATISQRARDDLSTDPAAVSAVVQSALRSSEFSELKRSALTTAALAAQSVREAQPGPADPATNVATASSLNIFRLSDADSSFSSDSSGADVCGTDDTWSSGGLNNAPDTTTTGFEALSDLFNVNDDPDLFDEFDDCEFNEFGGAGGNTELATISAELAVAQEAAGVASLFGRLERLAPGDLFSSDARPGIRSVQTAMGAHFETRDPAVASAVIAFFRSQFESECCSRREIFVFFTTQFKAAVTSGAFDTAFSPAAADDAGGVAKRGSDRLMIDPSNRSAHTALLLLGGFMDMAVCLPSVWIREGERHLELVVSTAFAFMTTRIGIGPGAVTISNLIALTDPSAGWFARWCDSDFGRRGVFRYLRSSSEWTTELLNVVVTSVAQQLTPSVPPAPPDRRLRAGSAAQAISSMSWGQASHLNALYALRVIGVLLKYAGGRALFPLLGDGGKMPTDTLVVILSTAMVAPANLPEDEIKRNDQRDLHSMPLVVADVLRSLLEVP